MKLKENLTDPLKKSVNACKELSALMEKAGFASFKEIEKAVLSLEKAELKVEQEIKKKSEHDTGIRFRKDCNKWEALARTRINGKGSSRFASKICDTKENAIAWQKQILENTKKAIDRAITNCDKVAIFKGHYIDIVDIKKVPTTENVVVGSFGQMDERM